MNTEISESRDFLLREGIFPFLKETGKTETSLRSTSRLKCMHGAFAKLLESVSNDTFEAYADGYRRLGNKKEVTFEGYAGSKNVDIAGFSKKLGKFVSAQEFKSAISSFTKNKDNHLNSIRSEADNLRCAGYIYGSILLVLKDIPTFSGRDVCNWEHHLDNFNKGSLIDRLYSIQENTLSKASSDAALLLGVDLNVPMDGIKNKTDWFEFLKNLNLNDISYYDNPKIQEKFQSNERLYYNNPYDYLMKIIKTP